MLLSAVTRKPCSNSTTSEMGGLLLFPATPNLPLEVNPRAGAWGCPDTRVRGSLLSPGLCLFTWWGRGMLSTEPTPPGSEVGCVGPLRATGQPTAALENIWRKIKNPAKGQMFQCTL